MDVPHLQRNLLKDQIRDLLLERIISGKIKPGERIKELQIAEELGTSQAPVREALICLEIMGYIEHRSHAGAWVRVFAPQDAIETYQIREALEVYSIARGMAAVRKGLDRIQDWIARMHESAGLEDRVTYSQNDLLFHRFIVEASGNAKMLELWDSLKVRAAMIATLRRSTFNMQMSAALHDPIADAIRRDDVREASAQISRHYDIVMEHWVMEVQKDGAPH
jgi:DNA-binding GntR family transcriptional regulator